MNQFIFFYFHFPDKNLFPDPKRLYCRFEFHFTSLLFSPIEYRIAEGGHGPLRPATDPPKSVSLGNLARQRTWDLARSVLARLTTTYSVPSWNVTHPHANARTNTDRHKHTYKQKHRFTGVYTFLYNPNYIYIYIYNKNLQKIYIRWKRWETR